METSVEDRPEPRATLWRYHHKQALRDALLRVLAQHIYGPGPERTVPPELVLRANG